MLFAPVRLIFLIMLAFLPSFTFAASVPTQLPTASPPETCEEDVWDIIKNRAEMEANREIVQNQNLISKPDSVLMLTCFDRQMAHLGNYAQNNFPSQPDESLSNGVSIGGVFTDIMIILVRDLLGDSDPYLTGGRIPPPGSPLSFVKGGQLIHLLEILILDNLVDGVSSIANAYDNILLLGCGKDFYIDDNAFDGVLLGGRASTNTTLLTFPSPPNPPGWFITAGNVQMADSLPEAVFNGCPKMNEIWNQARCNGFQMDRMMGAVLENDRFHPLKPIESTNAINSYVNHEITGNDYRIYPEMCRWNMIDPVGDLACRIREYGIPPLPNTAAEIASFILNSTTPGAQPWTSLSSAPTLWQDLATNSTVVSGGPGGVDGYIHRREIFRGATAAECTAVQPVRTGLIVNDVAGNQYYDAVCPAAGCWFAPPATLAGTGTCNR